jgi:2-oxoisovalerate dehydrogenase E2 component (dihydrolipoyl transacylase)
MTTFNLPDLGEGLPEAEIVTWHIKEGDTIKVDQPMVSVETAKAVVEVPSPHAGVVAKLHAQEGDIVATGAPLIDFSDSPAAIDTAPPPPEGEASPAQSDGAATVVGNMPTGGGLIEETAVAGGKGRRKKARVKATPSVRTEARRLGVDLGDVQATGRNGQITAGDLANFASRAKTSARPPASREGMAPGRTDTLRGPRRAMAQSMARTRDEVAVCTIFDDADINDWINKRDFTARMLRSMVAGCTAEPRLNGFFDAERLSHQIESRVDIAMAVDTEDGLIVPVIRNVEEKSLEEMRTAVAAIKQATIDRTVSPQDMVNYTITLSNFGMLAGRYASPLMVPPTIAILGSGKLQHDVVAVMGGIEVHRRIPLSLSFDHRCATGGDACRFLAAVIKDLEKPE